jgi:hypothetical protein
MNIPTGALSGSSDHIVESGKLAKNAVSTR